MINNCTKSGSVLESVKYCRSLRISAWQSYTAYIVIVGFVLDYQVIHNGTESKGILLHFACSTSKLLPFTFCFIIFRIIMYGGYMICILHELSATSISLSLRQMTV